MVFIEDGPRNHWKGRTGDLPHVKRVIDDEIQVTFMCMGLEILIYRSILL